MFTGRERSARLLALAGAGVFAVATFVLPYRLAVPETVSESYRVDFNNHAALLLFLLCAGCFCVGVGGFGWPVRRAQAGLPRWTLAAAVLLSVIVCVSWRLHRQHQPLGSESGYLINRQIQMAAGLRPYRDLEFIYGPLLLYPGYWLLTGLHLSPLHAYMSSWVAFWTLGTAMLWVMVAGVALPTRHRWAVFALLFLVSLEGFRSEGAHYTPLRTFCAGFCSVVVAAVWRKTRDPRLTAGAMVSAVLFGFLVSPEQGTALALGLSAYALLLGWAERERFPWRCALLVPSAAIFIVALANKAEWLRSMHGFAQGGNNFPLLPSAINFFVLGIYLCAIATLYHAVLHKEWESAVLPLGLCGLPMLTSAFGRCDVGHLTSAVPLYLLGILWLTSRPWTFRVWLVLSCWFLLDVGGMTRPLLKLRRVGVALAALPSPEPSTATVGIPQGELYFAPLLVPANPDGSPRWGARSGYFYGIQNVLTPGDINLKAQEIEQSRAPFLLLPDDSGPPKMLFWAAEESPAEVRTAEQSVWMPRLKHPLPSTAAVTAAIENRYDRTAFHEDGWRVWKRRQP